MTDAEEARHHLELLKKALKTKTDVAEFGPPELVTIDHDDYHAEHVGNAAGCQFFLTTPFDWDRTKDSRREFVALYLFDFDGNLLEAKIDEFDCEGPEPQKARRDCYNKRLSDLGKVIFGRIAVKPFAVEKFGTAFGLIPLPPQEDEDEVDGWTVELLPGNYMAFNAPWDQGGYDT